MQYTVDFSCLTSLFDPITQYTRQQSNFIKFTHIGLTFINELALQWMTLHEVLDQSINKKINLAPPQLYEIGRLLNFYSIEELDSFSKMRADKGCPRILPVRINFQDGVASILPGRVYFTRIKTH